MFKNFVIFVLVCIFCARPQDCCDIPKLVTEEDEKECGLALQDKVALQDHYPPGAPPCDKDICILKKYDLISGDDKVDKGAVKSFLDKWSADVPEVAGLVDSMNTKCIERDLAALGPPELCEPMKMRHCLIKTTMMECPKWKQTEECTELKQRIDNCMPYFKKLQ